MKGLEYHILSHTHWDREWYQTYQQFRRKLVLFMDELLDILENNPDFKHFHLDGQTILLEDYLELRPENEKRITKLIKQNRISIGPWYVAGDTFLVHGESTIRNLLIGYRVAKQFGKPCKVGYLPDQFGIISQMPQILRGFGISHALFGRGYIPGEKRKAEIEWKGPEGSKVFALFLPTWYCNFIRPSQKDKEALIQLEEARDRLLPHLQSPFLLLMNGCDHLNVQGEIPEIIKKLNSGLSEGKVIHARLDEYLKKVSKAVKKSTPWQGEFREDHQHKILAGTLSSRIYLKQANNECESQLLTAETLQLLSSRAGYIYEREYLEKCWKLLLQNQAHDSICGCSIDQVHREMIFRFDQVKQMASETSRESLNQIAQKLHFSSDPKHPYQGLLVVNPVAVSRNEALDVTIDFPISQPERFQSDLKISSRIPQHLSILDENGDPVPFHVHRTEETVSQCLSRSDRPQSVSVQRFHIQIPIEIGPLEYRSFQVIPRKGKTVRTRLALKVGNNRIENEYIQVMAGGDGSISIRDKKTGHLFGPLLVFDDGGDVGDTYLYKCPANDRSVTTQGRPAQTRPVVTTPYQGTLQIERIVTIPETADIHEERRERSTIDCIISTRITLRDGDPTLYCETRLENKAKYHRLRVLFRSNLPTRKALADSPFDLIERPARPPEEWQDAAWQFPLRTYVALENEEQGIALFTRGLHEYELVNTDNGTLALTLLRCVGHLSRGRECFHWFETPEAQCQGIHRFEFAIHIYQGSIDRINIPRLAATYNQPLLSHSFTPDTGKKDPRRNQLFSVEPVSVLVTAVKRCEDRESIFVRLFNSGEETTEMTLDTGFSLSEAYQLDMLETRKKKLTPKKTGLSLSLKAKEIANFELVG